MSGSRVWMVAVLTLAAELGGCGGSTEFSRPKPKPGKVVIEVEWVACPTLAYYGAAPVTAAVGETIQLIAEAQEDIPGDPAGDFTWSATSGSIRKPHAPTTTFRCQRAGSVTITLTLANESCCETVEVEVECTEAVPRSVT